MDQYGDHATLWGKRELHISIEVGYSVSRKRDGGVEACKTLREEYEGCAFDAGEAGKIFLVLHLPHIWHYHPYFGVCSPALISGLNMIIRPLLLLLP